MMKPEHQIIINTLSEFLEKFPDQRFGQALLNLEINETDFVDGESIARDIYYDTDEDILHRLKSKWNRIK